MRTSKLKIENWNPTVKAATILISVILLSFVYKVYLNILIFATAMVILLFFSNARAKRILQILIPATIAAFGLFIMGLYYARGNSVTDQDLSTISAAPYMVRAAMSQNFYTALQLSTRLMAYAGLGILFALTTDGEFFISSLMHQCKMSPKFAYGTLAAFHLMPGMVREYKNVKTAFEVRGISTKGFSMKPLFTMLVNSVRWSESIAMAMESKGFCGEAKRTYTFIPKVHFSDWLIAVLMIAEVVLGMIFISY